MPASGANDRRCSPVCVDKELILDDSEDSEEDEDGECDGEEDEDEDDHVGDGDNISRRLLGFPSQVLQLLLNKIFIVAFYFCERRLLFFTDWSE